MGRETEIEKDNNILKETVSTQNEAIKGLKLSLQLTKEALKAEEEDHNELKNKYHEQILETERKENSLRKELYNREKLLNGMFYLLKSLYRAFPDKSAILDKMIGVIYPLESVKEIWRKQEMQAKTRAQKLEQQKNSGGIKR